MRAWRWAALAAVALAAGVGGAAVAAAASVEAPGGDEELVEAVATEPSAVHVGEPVSVTVRECAPPLTVTSIEPQVYQGGRGPWAPVRFDPAAADVRPTEDGIAFTFVTAEAEVSYRFAATCSDGRRLVTADGEVVLSFPPPGQLWFLDARIFPWGGRAGDPAQVLSVRSLECVDGATATAVLDLGDAVADVVVAATVGAYLPGLVDFELAVPADAPVGDHLLTVACETATGGTVTDAVTFTVFPAEVPPPATTSPPPPPSTPSTLVPTGSDTPSWWMGTSIALALAGLGLALAARLRSTAGAGGAGQP